MSVQFSVDVARTALQDAQVGPEVQKIGVSFRSLPPDAVVVNSVAPETWGQGRFRGGEEVVAVNGIDVATMDRENFKEALKVRPLTIRFRVPVDSKDELHTAVADSSIDKIGLSFLQLPPEPVLVNKVISDSWAEQAGFEGGEEIVIVNGREVSSMTSDEFKASLKERPLALRFRIDALPDGVEELLVGEDVDKIGLSFLQLPPDPVFVNKVVSGTWADEQGFTGGEEILALDGESVDAMSPESFKVALKRRPLTLRFRLPESDGPMDVTADASVQKIGLTFTQLPPEPVVVSKVASGTWAENVGFRGGEEIVAVNGLDCIAMGQHEFKALLKSRPLTLRFFPPEDPQETASKDGKVGTLEQQREKAALKIQAVQRGKVARKATAEEKKQKEEAARKIQAVQRGKAARAAMAESTKEQPASKKAAPETEASPKDKTTAGARTEQKKKPSKSGKTDPEEQQREEAALKIQAVQRGKAARKATAEEKKQKEEAAMKIQAVQRGKAARAAMAESRKEQPASKKAMPKPKAPPKDKTTAGARTEQKKKPSKSGKTDPEEQQREEAALKIQAVQRGKAARKATTEEKKQKEEAAMKIQAVQRGKAARAAMAESRKEQPASKNAVPKPKAPPKDKIAAGATADQKKRPLMKKPKVPPSDKTAAGPTAEQKDKPTNSSKSGKTDPEEQQREEAALKIQAVQRGKAARKATAEEKKQKEEAARKIQAVQRGKAARAAMAESTKEQPESKKAVSKPKAPPKDKSTAGARTEQKKKASKSGKTDPEEQQREEAALKIQAVQRGKAARKATAEEKKQKEEAAMKIQAVQRGKAARAAMAESRKEQPASKKAAPDGAGTEQKKKPSKSGKTDPEEQQREEAALKIQAVQRGKAARKATAEEKKQKEEAAMKIQAVQRGNAARAAMAESRKEQPASKKAMPKPKAPPKDKTTAGARTEQKKKPSKSGKTDPEEQQREEAALKIQAVQRGKAARKATAEEKKQKEEAAMKIQAVQRGKAARAAMAESSKDQPASKNAVPKPKAPPNDKTTAGATADQKAPFLESLEEEQNLTVEEQKQREEAAVKIQAVQRGKAARKATAEEKKEKEEAATKIQAVQRGKAARAAMAEGSNEQRASDEASQKPKAPPKDKTAADATAEQKKRPSKKQQDKGVPKPKAQQKCKTGGAVPSVQKRPCSTEAVPGVVEELTAEEEKQREEAAVKIQAVHRGKAARAAMAESSTGQPASRKTGSKRKSSKGYAAATATSEQKRQSRKKVDRNSQEDANSSKDGSRSPRRSASVGPTLSTAQRAGRKSQRNSEDPESEAPRSPSRCSQGKLDDAKSRESSRSASARSGSKSPKSPKSRPRGSLLSLGDADVHLSFRVNGLDDILAEHAMTTEYEEALKRVIVRQAGAGLQTKHLQLKSSGAKVNAKISAPPTVPRAMLHSCLANSSGALSAALEEELASSIAALEGRGREALSVEGLELRFGEVSRNSSILDTSGRFAVWPGGCLSEDSPTPKSTSRQRSGARSAAPRREASSRPASPRTPRTPRAGSEAALSRFRSELLRRGGTYAAAWRRILDCAGHGYLSFAEFCDACRRMSYSGNVKDAWHALDADGSGKVTLCELHWATAEALSRFVASLQSSFGGLEMAAKALGRGGRRLRKEEFRSWMQEQQVLSASEADSIFKMICSDSTMSRPSVRAEDIDWLAHLLPHLPLPKGRVPPGASVAETTVDLPEGPDAPQTATAARTPRSASQPARRPLQDGEDLYDRLHREAKDYHARKKEKHEKEGLFRPPGTPPETKACGNTVHLEKLYKMGQMQKRKQEKMADEYYAQLLGNRHKKKVPDEEVWARLQAKREVREVKSEPEDKPKEQTKHKGPSRPPPSGSVKEASERLYAAARKIESKKKELAERADQETRSKEEELKKKVGPITKAREVEIVKRLHREDQQKREEESMKRQQEKEAQEEEIRRLAVRKQGKVRPETFFRLHLDRLQREETLAEKRRMKEQQEEKKLKAESIHNRSTHNPRVFHRLYQSKGRPMEVLQTWLQPGVPTDAEEDAAYSGSEMFEDETTSRASRPPERTARREPAREAARTRREGAPKAEPGEAEEDDFREMLSGHRQKAELVPKVALDDLNVWKGPTGQAPGTATSSRIPPGERTEWNGGDESPNDEIDGLVRISRRPLGSLRPSSAPRRSVAADLSRELFGDSNDEEPLPSHSSHLRNAGAWDAMTEMISWDKEP